MHSMQVWAYWKQRQLDEAARVADQQRRLKELEREKAKEEESQTHWNDGNDRRQKQNADQECNARGV